LPYNRAAIGYPGTATDAPSVWYGEVSCYYLQTYRENIFNKAPPTTSTMYPVTSYACRCNSGKCKPSCIVGNVERVFVESNACVGRLGLSQ